MDFQDPEENATTALRQGPDRVVDATTPFVLTVKEGPDRGAELVIDGATRSSVLIGSSPTCDLRLTDVTVSRRHGAFELTDRGLRYRDLQSTNGTRLGGFAIVEVLLNGGEELTVGDTRVSVARLGERKVFLPAEVSFGRLIGASREMRRLFGMAAAVAQSDVPVIVEGETGTGKELLAEAIHERSRRATKPFVVIDCTAIAPSLIEAELFGHERGAYTGAIAARSGLFAEAHGGTLFIDEIGDLDIALQSKLLRAIERGEVRRVGGNKWVTVDVRVVVATRRDLDKEVQAGRFRDDLFYRLAVARLELPPLRKRTGDVVVLAQHFWRELGGVGAFPQELAARFAEYDWPGNVRELQNAVSKRIALGEYESTNESANESASGEVTASVPATSNAVDIIDQVIARELPFTTSRDKVMDEFERRYVQAVLARSKGNIGEAAKASGLARRYFQIIRARQRGV